MQKRLPAEWEDQDGVLLAWPHEDSDWAPVLEQVEPVFAQIAAAVSRFEKVLLVVQDEERVKGFLSRAGAHLDRVYFASIPVNDTWSRDFGPITVYQGKVPLILDFGFNGWGLKFASHLDNQITRKLFQKRIFGKTLLKTLGMILEGGSIESDGRGTILTTSQCLLSPNRNPHLSRGKVEKKLYKWLGAQKVLWLDYGYLAGDDTDSHIDTLARLCPDHKIAYVACDDPQDEHYQELLKMRGQLESFISHRGSPYTLYPLPWPKAVVDEEGQRLPATYANFLIINEAVLVPLYEDPKDEEALKVMKDIFPDREIVGINCRPLILQHGSLHCVTMQIPKGAWA